jgi:hypothetical protein
VSHAASYSKISGNIVTDSGYGWDTSIYGIWVHHYDAIRDKSVIVSDNVIQQVSATSKQKWGITISGLLGGSVSGNVLYDSGETGQIQIVGDATYRVEAISVIDNNIYASNTETAAIVCSYFEDSLVDGNNIFNAGDYGIYFGTTCTGNTIGQGNKINASNTEDYYITSPMLNDWQYERIGTGLYNFTADGGAISSIDIGDIPNNATIIRAWYEVLTPPTSGGAATIAISTSQVANEIVTATAYDNAVFAAGFHDGIPDGTAANFTTKATAKRDINFTIAGATLTAGKIRIWWEYIHSE